MDKHTHHLEVSADCKSTSQELVRDLVTWATSHEHTSQAFALMKSNFCALTHRYNIARSHCYDGHFKKLFVWNTGRNAFLAPLNEANGTTSTKEDSLKLAEIGSEY